MTLSIDHIIIYVEDLQSAINQYREAGFTTNYGGQHADGITENGLIVFSDGSYLELIALVEGKPYAEAGFKGLLKESGQGYTGLAFQSDAIEADLSAIAERGITVGEIREGSRARPDGELLQWKMAFIENAMSPFVIQDVTDRDLRVPLNPENTTHDNGARGIHEVLIRVSDFEQTLELFSNIMGTPMKFPGSARFEIGTSAVVLTQSTDGSLLPEQLSLYTDESEPKPVELTGAKFLFI